VGGVERIERVGGRDGRRGAGEGFIRPGSRQGFFLLQQTKSSALNHPLLIHLLLNDLLLKYLSLNQDCLLLDA